MIPQKVQVFGIHRSDRNGQRRYWTRWRIDGRDRTRSFKTKAEAERLAVSPDRCPSRGPAVRSGHRLPDRVAPVRGDLVDLVVGVAGAQVATVGWQHPTIRRRSPGRRYCFDGDASSSSIHLMASSNGCSTSAIARTSPTRLGLAESWPGSNAGRSRLAELTPRSWRSRSLVATTRAGRPADGRDDNPPSTQLSSSRFSTLRSAVVHLDVNPMTKMEWRMPKRSVEIDISVVPSVADIMDVYNHIAGLESPGRRYAAFFATIGLSGMRPSEVAGLYVSDLTLPDDGWGLARLRGALTTPGTRYSGSDGVTESKGLKHRAPPTSEKSRFRHHSSESFGATFTTVNPTAGLHQQRWSPHHPSQLRQGLEPSPCAPVASPSPTGRCQGLRSPPLSGDHDAVRWSEPSRSRPPPRTLRRHAHEGLRRRLPRRERPCQ